MQASHLGSGEPGPPATGLRQTITRALPALSWKSSRAVSVTLFLLALVLRLLHLREARHSPYFGSLFLDAEEYQSLARGLLSGGWEQAAADTYVHGVPLRAILG